MNKRYLYVIPILAALMILAGCVQIPREKGKMDFKAKESMGLWYEQSPRQAALRIKDGYLEYSLEGEDGSWKGGMFNETKEGDVYSFYPNIIDQAYDHFDYYPKEDVIRAINLDDSGAIAKDEEVIFMRTKYVPEQETQEETESDAKNDPAPDESISGDWLGFFSEVSGSYNMTVEEPDASGVYPVTINFVWNYSDSGGGMYVDYVDVTGSVAVDADGLMIMSGSYVDGSNRPESERSIKAKLEQQNDGLLMTVLECDQTHIQAGDSFEFAREAD